MKKRRPLDRRQLKEKPVLRKEWVSIAAGDVCVWGMSAADMLTLGERTQRPAIDPRGGVDPTAGALYLAALCTHEGDDDESPRVWDDLHIQEITLLSGDDWIELQQAIQRVNGRSAEEVESMRDFSPATGAPKSSASPSSASSNSTGSPLSSATSPTPT
jgi:hypothetical protein